MRLLIWTESYWVGGSDRFVGDLLPGLRGRGLDVTMAGNPLQPLDDWLAARVPWVVPRETVRISNLVDSPLARMRRRVAEPQAALAGEIGDTRPGVMAVGTAALRSRAAALNQLRIKRLMARLRPEAVLINNGGYPGGESSRLVPTAARVAGARSVAHFVHNMAYPPAWPAGIEHRLDRRADAATDIWLTAADRASDALAAQRGFDRDRVRTIHYGIPEPEPVADRDAARAELGFGDPGAVGLLVVAAFEPRKGHAWFLDALTQVDDPRVRVAFVGTGPEEQRVRDQIAAVGLGDRVKLLGWRDDVQRLMPAADALVLPSLGNECLPYAILEAMSHGLPVVGTDVAGIPEEIEDGVTGEVVAPGDVPAMAGAIGWLAGDADRARRRGEDGRRRWARMFRVDRMVDDVLAQIAPGRR
jgi:glycosyltransferase involved in cell wall biosynthesis